MSSNLTKFNLLQTVFALVDCNNFYASCERVFRPDLNGKPIVVLSNNDGCCIARSNEAKALGIPMGAPAFEYEKLFVKNKVHVFSANFALYGDMSNRVMSILSEYSPDMEIYSIDEAFLKFKGFDYFDFKAYIQTIKQKVQKGTGIPISIGIAPTKALAKLANRISKKYALQTNGIHIIDTELKREKALKWVKVEDVWGIGGQHAKRLNAISVYTAFDFIALNSEWVRKNMSVVGLRLQKELQGIPTLDLEDIAPKKNIATTRSFETMFTKLEEITERVSTFAVSCAEKLRKQNSCCSSLMVFIQSNGFRQDLSQYGRNVVLKLPYATNSSIELTHFAILALQKIFVEGYHYKKAGVIVMDFSSENETQLSLFDNSQQRHQPLMKAIDKLNDSYGQQKVRLASQDLKRVWKMKQEHLSPKYTTKLSDIITVNT
jgi:DNA polymerase V